MRFVDWLFERVFFPERQKWARARVAELVSEREMLYRRLMAELQVIEDCVRAEREDDQHD